MYHFEYKDVTHKRVWIMGFKKTFKVNMLPTICDNYTRIEKEVRQKAKKQKLKVAFLISETEKWQYQTLYEGMEKSTNFEPFIVVVPINYKNKDIQRLHETYRFFKTQKHNVFYGYDIERKKYIPLEEFKADIVFYQQPWGISPIQHILPVSKFALTAYCPYAIVENEQVFDDACLFFDALWRHYVADETARQALKNKNFRIENIIITGHPKMDWALDIVSKEQKKKHPQKTIIYAPHHSFSKNGLQWATFEWSGQKLLELNKRYPQYMWILKPHPLFQKMLIKEGIMTEDAFKKYCQSWQEHGKIVTGGNYFELFGQSDLLITDCGSFLAEYALTQKPVIRLIAQNAYPQHPYNEKLSQNYYKVYDSSSIEQVFQEVVLNGNDFLKEKREADFQKEHFGEATQKILLSLTHDLEL